MDFRRDLYVYIYIKLLIIYTISYIYDMYEIYIITLITLILK